MEYITIKATSLSAIAVKMNEMSKNNKITFITSSEDTYRRTIVLLKVEEKEEENA